MSTGVGARKKITVDVSIADMLRMNGLLFETLTSVM